MVAKIALEEHFLCPGFEDQRLETCTSQKYRRRRSRRPCPYDDHAPSFCHGFALERAACQSRALCQVSWRASGPQVLRPPRKIRGGWSRSDAPIGSRGLA